LQFQPVRARSAILLILYVPVMTAAVQTETINWLEIYIDADKPTRPVTI
jgi:hypothetical protein